MRAGKALTGSGTAMNKGGIAEAVASAMEMKTSQIVMVLDRLTGIGTQETMHTGKITLPGP